MNAYTKAAAKRLLPFASLVEIVRVLRNCIQVTYLVKGRRCSTFLSKKAFVESNTTLRVEGSKTVEIVEMSGDRYIVKSKDNYYTVTPKHYDPKERCECGDCYYRGARCKHQVAVAEFISRLFALAV